jgi:hypothetical protein
VKRASCLVAVLPRSAEVVLQVGYVLAGCAPLFRCLVCVRALRWRPNLACGCSPVSVSDHRCRCLCRWFAWLPALRSTAVCYALCVQMPRGNLEGVAPRGLTVASVRQLIDAFRFKGAMVYMPLDISNDNDMIIIQMITIYLYKVSRYICMELLRVFPCFCASRG